jgi:2-oxo-4-hydroxy-4-carboxy-5-ureidoimidazoline decarboxylase
MSEVLTRWNGLRPDEAVGEILPCCGSRAWAQGMAERRPLVDETALLTACDQVCESLAESDWMEAFDSHPRIGESPSPGSSTQSAGWSEEEQQRAAAAKEDVKVALAEGNREYEQRFKRIFIVCATGKSAQEILGILRRRLRNERVTELHEAADEQRLITRLRLKKWLSR